MWALGWALPGLVLVSACSDTVRVETPTVAPPLAERCRELVASLPERLAGADRRPVRPQEGRAAAWGDDPPIVLRCGVAVPPALTPTSVCEEVDGVGWFLPVEQLEDPGSDLEYTTVGFVPRVSLQVPAAYRSVITSVTVPLSDPILDALDLVEPCV